MGLGEQHTTEGFLSITQTDKALRNGPMILLAHRGSKFSPAGARLFKVEHVGRYVL